MLQEELLDALVNMWVYSSPSPSRYVPWNSSLSQNLYRHWDDIPGDLQYTFKGILALNVYLKIHIWVEDCKFNVAGCGKEFSYKSNITRHNSRMHIKDRKHKCQWQNCEKVCNNAFEIREYKGFQVWEKKERCEDTRWVVYCLPVVVSGVQTGPGDSGWCRFLVKSNVCCILVPHGRYISSPYTHKVEVGVVTTGRDCIVDFGRLCSLWGGRSGREALALLQATPRLDFSGCNKVFR